MFLVREIDPIFLIGHLVQKLSSSERSSILQRIADALEANIEVILEKNDMDIQAAEKMGLSKSLLARLQIKPGKVRLS